MENVIGMSAGSDSGSDQLQIRLNKPADQLNDHELREVLAFLIEKINVHSQLFVSVKGALQGVTSIAESVEIMASRYETLEEKQQFLTESMATVSRLSAETAQTLQRIADTIDGLQGGASASLN